MYIHVIFSENLVYIHDIFKNFLMKIVNRFCGMEKGGSIFFKNTSEHGSGEGEKVPDLDPDPVPEHSTQYTLHSI